MDIGVPLGRRRRYVHLRVGGYPSPLLYWTPCCHVVEGAQFALLPIPRLAYRTSLPSPLHPLPRSAVCPSLASSPLPIPPHPDPTALPCSSVRALAVFIRGKRTAADTAAGAMLEAVSADASALADADGAGAALRALRHRALRMIARTLQTVRGRPRWEKPGRVSSESGQPVQCLRAKAAESALSGAMRLAAAAAVVAARRARPRPRCRGKAGLCTRAVCLFAVGRPGPARRCGGQAGTALLRETAVDALAAAQMRSDEVGLCMRVRRRSQARY